MADLKKVEEILAQLNDDERAILEETMKAKNKPVTLKVGEKGGVCVYGINGRFPVTLYANQWQRFADEGLIPKILAFIDDKKDRLSVK